MSENGILELVNLYNKYATYFNEAKRDWVKNIILLNGTILAIVTTLKSVKSETYLEYCLFITPILGFLVSILCGTIFLYGEIAMLGEINKSLMSKIKEYDHDKDNSFEDLITLRPVYLFFEKCCYIFSLIALVVLVISVAIFDYPY
jgi:uncharacterized membrane protein